MILSTQMRTDMNFRLIRKTCALVLGLSVFCAAPALAESGDAGMNQAGGVAAGSSGKLEMDMGQAVAYALGQNQTLQGAAEQAKAAESGRKSSLGAFGPALSTSYGFDRVVPAPRMMGFEEDASVYTWTVSVNQAIFTGFRLISEYRKAALQRDFYASSLFDTELSLITTVQENFLILLKARENVRSAEDSLTRLKEQLRVTTAFYDEGMRPKLDVLQAQVDAANAENFLLQAQNALDTQIARLNTLLNLPVEAPIAYVGSLDYIPFEATLEQCLGTAYGARPDVAMASQNVDIARQDKRIAASEFYPQVSGYFNTQTQGDTWRAAGSENRPTGYHDWNIGVGASWSLFEWGRTFYAVQQAGHLVSKARADENALHEEVAYEVKSNLLSINEAKKRIKVAQYGLAQAKEAYRSALARYQAQVGTNTDVLDAQSKLTAAEASLTEAQADYLISLSVLYSSIGIANPSLEETLSPQAVNN